MKKLWQKILAFITNNRIHSIMITALAVIIIIVLISLISNCNKNQGQTTMPITTSAITSSTTQSPSISTTFAPASTSITTSPPLTTIGTTASPITTAATISISFNAYGGSPVSSETIVPGSTILISNKSSTYTNHNFLGWFTAPNGQGTQVNDATIFNTSQTLYAFWELMPRITITFETNGGDAIDPVVFYSNTGEHHTINQVPIRIGYSFDGWYDHSGLTGEAVTGTIFISQDTTFYAKWSVDTTHITYEEYYDPYSGIRGYYISEVSDSYSGTELLLPAEIDGNPIIGINASAAESLGIRKATKIIFDEGYEVIGANAFNVWSPQNTLTEVVLPSTMKFIGDNAFYNQNALVNVNISSCENLIGLDNYVFANTALTEVSLPDSVLNLGIGIFEGITTLSSFSFPVTTHFLSIPPRMFYNASNLTSIIIPSSIKSIGYWAFSKTGIDTIVIPSSLTHINEEAFALSNIETVTFENEENIVYLSNNVFKGTPYLSTYPSDYLIINDLLVKYLGDGVNVVIPNEVVAISEGAFTGVTIENITFNANLKEIRPYAFHQAIFLNAITLPDTIQLIGKYAFNYATFASQTLTMPSGLVTLGISAFEASYHLPEVVFQAGTPLKKIGDRAFYVVSDFATITLHDGLEAIGVEAFFGDPLTAVTIPASVTTIGKDAFASCNSLASVTFLDAGNLSNILSNPFVATSWLNNHPDDYVVVGKYLLKYKGASSDVVIPPGVEVIVMGAIQTLPVAITSLDLGSVVTICDGAITGYFPNLTSVHIPATVKYIGSSAISSSASSITSITWEAGFNPTYVGSSAFGMVAPYDKFQEVTADNLVIFGDYLHLATLATGQVTVPDGIKYIGPYAFRNAQVTEVILPDSLEVIYQKAFDNAVITSMTIPANVHSIYEHAFSNTSSLESVTFADSSALVYVGNYLFDNSSVIHNYLTPEGYFVIGDVLFGVETVVDTITVPDLVNVFAMRIASPAKTNHLVIPGHVMVVTQTTYPGDSVVTLDFSGYFPNNEYHLAFFRMFYDPEIIISDVLTIVMPSDVTILPHYIKEITTTLTVAEIAMYFDCHHPSVVAPE